MYLSVHDERKLVLCYFQDDTEYKNTKETSTFKSQMKEYKDMKYRINYVISGTEDLGKCIEGLLVRETQRIMRHGE